MEDEEMYNLFDKMIDSGVLDPQKISILICEGPDKLKDPFDLTVDDFAHMSDDQILDVLKEWVEDIEIPIYDDSKFSWYDDPEKDDPDYLDNCIEITPFADLVSIIQQIPNRYTEKFENKIALLGKGFELPDGVETPDYKYESSKKIANQYRKDRTKEYWDQVERDESEEAGRRYDEMLDEEYYPEENM